MNTADSNSGPDKDNKDSKDSKDSKEEEDKLYEPGMQSQDVVFFDKSTNPSIPTTTMIPDTAPTTMMTSSTSNKNIGILPLFPLGLVLFPGALVPLHIFEMRYRRMFNKIREPVLEGDKEAENTFGLIMYDSAAKKMAQVGCAACVTKFQPLEDGRILVVNEGRRRFKVLEIISESPYITAKVEYFQDQVLESGHEEEAKEAMQLAVQVWDSLQKVLQLSNKLWDKGMDISQSLKDQSPLAIKTEGTTLEDRMKKIEKFSFGVASILDMPTFEQQTMLQTADVRRRLGKQKKLLDAAASQLQAQYAIKSALSDK
eukprot:CAMPEP_0184696556 /NCGR_PEP_ID=MMETSP0313-20130426/3802_1 /TAXON_ID=2792 /ORGANISM="Porphyridium aerugineum, Strain SAG 1380-2" /LENGTH=313 /DNA_ID=CAMNT_0027155191 /DNA_START=200 /DNA_END=1141 /DNA_ORIENTATION=-